MSMFGGCICLLIPFLAAAGLIWFMAGGGKKRPIQVPEIENEENSI
ncbi:MAG: hypothetical protein H6581_28610 [Bacteroidia bacterium]|nr:hypothetical protein [Bacteroidia bacterium]